MFPTEQKAAVAVAPSLLYPEAKTEGSPKLYSTCLQQTTHISTWLGERAEREATERMDATLSLSPKGEQKLGGRFEGVGRRKVRSHTSKEIECKCVCL